MPPSLQTEVAILSERVDTHDARFIENDDEHKQLWGVVNHLRDRLPLWATILIALLSSLCGGALAVLGQILFGV